MVVCCCKHPRLEAVPAPAFSQMFAAPGYAWTTAEGGAVMNPYVHLYLSSSVSTDRDELPPVNYPGCVWPCLWCGLCCPHHGLLFLEITAFESIPSEVFTGSVPEQLQTVMT